MHRIDERQSRFSFCEIVANVLDFDELALLSEHHVVAGRVDEQFGEHEQRGFDRRALVRHVHVRLTAIGERDLRPERIVVRGVPQHATGCGRAE